MKDKKGWVAGDEEDEAVNAGEWGELLRDV